MLRPIVLASAGPVHHYLQKVDYTPCHMVDARAGKGVYDTVENSNMVPAALTQSVHQLA